MENNDATNQEQILTITKRFLSLSFTNAQAIGLFDDLRNFCVNHHPEAIPPSTGFSLHTSGNEENRTDDLKGCRQPISTSAESIHVHAPNGLSLLDGSRIGMTFKRNVDPKKIHISVAGSERFVNDVTAYLKYKATEMSAIIL